MTNFACQATSDVTCAQTQLHLLYSICDEKQFCMPCSNRWHAIGIMQLLLVVRWYKYHQIQFITVQNKLFSVEI